MVIRVFVTWSLVLGGSTLHLFPNNLEIPQTNRQKNPVKSVTIWTNNPTVGNTQKEMNSAHQKKSVLPFLLAIQKNPGSGNIQNGHNALICGWNIIGEHTRILFSHQYNACSCPQPYLYNVLTYYVLFPLTVHYEFPETEINDFLPLTSLH